MKEENTLMITQMRAEIFKTLSVCFSKPVTLTSRHINTLWKSMSVISPEAATAVEKMSSYVEKCADLEELTIDHARLFIGPFSLLSPPFGSVYLDPERKVMGESTQGVMDLYMSFGLGLAPDFYYTPDHIIAELEFMYYLAMKEMEAITQMDEESRGSIFQNEKTFMEIYLAPWIKEFTDALGLHARTLFYKNLALATRIFIEKERRYFSENAL
jgi:TorA maturation chaperone TorD